MIAKITDAQGLQNLEDILDSCYGAVVGRGHLGLEITPEKVALAQNFMLSKTGVRGKVCSDASALVAVAVSIRPVIDTQFHEGGRCLVCGCCHACGRCHVCGCGTRGTCKAVPPHAASSRGDQDTGQLQVSIVARQMMSSMVVNPRPTRAEMTDVANAVFGSADSVLLGSETATGNFPVDAVETMASILRNAEEATHYYAVHSFMRDFSAKPFTAAEAVSSCLARSASDADIAAVVTFTATGAAAELVCKFRPAAPHLVVTGCRRLAAACNLYFGETGIFWEQFASGSATVAAGVAHALQVAQKRGLVSSGRVAVLHGTNELSGDEEGVISFLG